VLVLLVGKSPTLPTDHLSIVQNIIVTTSLGHTAPKTRQTRRRAIDRMIVWCSGRCMRLSFTFSAVVRGVSRERFCMRFRSRGGGGGGAVDFGFWIEMHDTVYTNTRHGYCERRYGFDAVTLWCFLSFTCESVKWLFFGHSKKSAKNSEVRENGMKSLRRRNIRTNPIKSLLPVYFLHDVCNENV